MTTIGLFGKTPMYGDFVRNNISAPVSLAFGNMLTDGVANLVAAKGTLPDSPVGFLYSLGGQDEVLVGAFVQSQDSVGRQFPLAIFATLEASLAARFYSAIPRAYDAFLNEAVGVLLSAPYCDVETLKISVSNLVPPDANRLMQVHQECSAELDAFTVAAFQEQIRSEVDGQHYYALYALLSACNPLRAAGPAKSGIITLECSIDTPTLCTAWLELTKRALQWPTAPSFFWTSAIPRRLLLTLGDPPPAVLNYVSGGAPNASRKWPLQTSSSVAVAAAKKELEPRVRAAIESSDGNWGQVLAAVTT